MFDNSYNIKSLAQDLQHLLKVPEGQEKQLFDVGDKVGTTNTCARILTNAIIIDLYQQNGFYYYVIEYDFCRRIKAHVTLRQKDIRSIL